MGTAASKGLIPASEELQSTLGKDISALVPAGKCSSSGRRRSLEWSSLVMRIPGGVQALEQSRDPEVTKEPVLR